MPIENSGQAIQSHPGKVKNSANSALLGVALNNLAAPP